MSSKIFLFVGFCMLFNRLFISLFFFNPKGSVRCHDLCVLSFVVILMVFFCEVSSMYTCLTLKLAQCLHSHLYHTYSCHKSFVS